MRSARLRRLPAHALTLALALLGAAAAQAPTYVATGTLTATVDGVLVNFATFVTVVPEPSETIDDARARAFAGALVGREVATATAITTPPLVVGEVVAMPATLTVELRGSVGAPKRDREDLRELVLGIRLDPATLAWTGVPDHVSVAYHPERWSGTAYYQLQDLVVLELTATAASPTALRVAGRLEATLVWREGAFQVRVDPSRTLALTVDFEVDPVIGNEALAALLGP
jgi:hypothetical protein